MQQARKHDNCQICLGVSGGVRGNENVMHGVVICDYCTVKLLHGAGSKAAAAALQHNDIREARRLIAMR